MDDIQPARDHKESGFRIHFRRAITRSSLDRIEWRVIIIARGIAFTIFGVTQFRIQMPTQPYETLKRCMKPIQKKMSHPDDQEGFPRYGENEEATGVDKDVSQTSP